MMLSDVCLSVAYIGPKSRTERPRKTMRGPMRAIYEDRIWQTQFPRCCTQKMELFTATSPFANHQFQCGLKTYLFKRAYI